MPLGSLLPSPSTSKIPVGSRLGGQGALSWPRRGWHATQEFFRRAPWVRDALLYAGAALLAWGTPLFDHLTPHLAWAHIAVWGYVAGVALALAFRARHRVLVLVLVGLLTIGLPLGVQVTSRIAAANPWSHAQSEVNVVERSAELWRVAGSPYALPGDPSVPPDTQVGANPFLAYNPYLPGMAVFGLPAAMLGHHFYTDARIWFALATLMCLLAAAALHPRGARLHLEVWQVLAILPPVALTIATGGDDMPVIALLVLSIALARKSRPGLTGIASGLAGALKPMAWPLVPFMAFFYLKRWGRKAALTYLGTAVMTSAPIMAAGIATGPKDAFAALIRFPLGLTRVKSPAASPMPGHLIATYLPDGRLILGALITVAVVAILAYTWLHPPRDSYAAGRYCAVMLTTVIVLAPQSRFGYLLYPLVLSVVEVGARLYSGAGRPRHATAAGGAEAAATSGSAVAVQDRGLSQTGQAVLDQAGPDLAHPGYPIEFVHGGSHDLGQAGEAIHDPLHHRLG